MRGLLAVVLLAGACRGGTGTDGPLATLPGPSALAVDDSGVYVAGADRLIRVPLGGGEVITLARGDIRNVAVDATYIHYVVRDFDRSVMEIHRMGKDGGGDAVVASDWPLNDIASDASWLYWISRGLKRRVHAGGEAEEVEATSLGSEIALDAGDLYFESEGEVRRISRRGGPSETVVADRLDLSDVAVGGDTIFWSENWKSVWRARPGGEPERIPLEPAGFFADLASAGGDLFIAESMKGAIIRVPAGGKPAVIARGVHPWRLAVHVDHVYFIERSDDDARGTVGQVERR